MKINKQTINRLIEQQYKQLLREQEYSLNISTTPLSKAVEYAKGEFNKVGKDLYTVIPDFNKNYLILQKKIKQYELGIPRIDMPVIEPQDMNKFYTELKSGAVDVFTPWFNPKVPTNFNTNKPIKLSSTIDGKWGRVATFKLKPTQSEIWLDNMIPNIIKFGVPTEERMSEKPLIASKEGYILDGHHRYGSAYLCNRELKMSVLLIPIEIKMLVPIAKQFSDEIGRENKE